MPRRRGTGDLKVIIAGAGGAAHLPGMVAANRPRSRCSVFRSRARRSRGWTVSSIAQMPGGIPVGTLAIGKAGAKNAGLLAAAILSNEDEALHHRLDAQVHGADLFGWRQSGGPLMAGLLAPGAIIGIIGGGQLGRMTALAAVPLGYRCHIYTPEENSPASQAAEKTTTAPFDDEFLAEFAATVDVITYEFENIPVDTLQRLEKLVLVRLWPGVLEVSQHRIAEKDFVRGSGWHSAPQACYRS